MKPVCAAAEGTGRAQTWAVNERQGCRMDCACASVGSRGSKAGKLVAHSGKNYTYLTHLHSKHQVAVIVGVAQSVEQLVPWTFQRPSRS